MSYGFDSLPNILATRITKHFNLMVVGHKNSGKTTFINSLFDFEFGDTPDVERKLKKVNLRMKEYKLKKGNVESKFTIVETKGFNNQLDKPYSYQPIVDYIDEKYDEHLRNELIAEETHYNDSSDNRIHCCIYILPPDKHGLSIIDIVTMKQLHQRVCLIPVIGHADMFTMQNICSLKEKIRQDIIKNNIEVYCPEKYDMPFAICASNDMIEENGKRKRLRSYTYGKMFIEEKYDFLKLKNLLFKHDMLSLIEVTDKVHYQKYQKEAMSPIPSRKKLEFDDYVDRSENLKKTCGKEIRSLELELY